MTRWMARAPEERSLFSPSFCATLLWRAARGHNAETAEAGGAMPFETAFLVLPMVLHREMREALPRTVATSLVVWINEMPLARSQIADRARLLVPFTKEALTFGGLHGLLSFSGGAVLASDGWKRKVSTVMKECSEEVQVCGDRAEFVGRWIARAGSAETVMALLGIRP